MKAVILGALLASLGTAFPAFAQSAEELRCASGFGCQGLAVTQDDSLVLLGLENADQAIDLYIEKHPDRYFDDAFPEPGEHENPAILNPSENKDIELFDGSETPDKEIDLFDGDDAPNQVIDLFEGEGDDASEERPSVLAPLMALEGYSDLPCAGALYERPKFNHMPNLGVGVCLDQNGFSPESCGLPAAHPFCVIERGSQAACFGLEVRDRTMNLGSVCQGECAAFSYIVCK